MSASLTPGPSLLSGRVPVGRLISLSIQTSEPEYPSSSSVKDRVNQCVASSSRTPLPSVETVNYPRVHCRYYSL